MLPRFVDHAVGAGAGGMNESDLPAVGYDEKSNVAIEPNNINTGSGEQDLLEEGVVVHSAGKRGVALLYTTTTT